MPDLALKIKFMLDYEQYSKYIYNEFEYLKITSVRFGTRLLWPTFVSHLKCGLFQSEETIPDRTQISPANQYISVALFTKIFTISRKIFS